MHLCNSSTTAPCLNNYITVVVISAINAKRNTHNQRCFDAASMLVLCTILRQMRDNIGTDSQSVIQADLAAASALVSAAVIVELDVVCHRLTLL